MNSSTPALVSLLIAILSFQAGASIAKSLFPLIGAPGTTALRLGLSAIIVSVLQRPWRSLPPRSAWPTLLYYGLALGTMNFTFYMAIRSVPLGVAVALEFTGPLAVACYHSQRKVDYLWVALAAIGVFFLLPIAPHATAVNPVGVLFALAAGVCWALYIVFGQRAGRAVGTAASTWGLLIAALLVVPVGIAMTGARLFEPSMLGRGLAVAVLSSAFPYTLEMIALRELSARTYGTLVSLDPAAAALTGVIVLHERLSLEQWLAVAAVTIASIGVVSSERQKAPELVA